MIQHQYFFITIKTIYTFIYFIYIYTFIGIRMLSQVSVLLPENWPWHCINNHWNLSHLIISSKYNNINKNSNLRKGTKKILLPRNVISGCSTFCILFSFDHPSSQILKNFCNKQKFLQLIKVMHKQQEDTLSKTNKYDFIFCVKIIYALNFIVNFIKKWSNTHYTYFYPY